MAYDHAPNSNALVFLYRLNANSNIGRDYLFYFLIITYKLTLNQVNVFSCIPKKCDFLFLLKRVKQITKTVGAIIYSIVYT